MGSEGVPFDKSLTVLATKTSHVLRREGLLQEVQGLALEGEEVGRFKIVCRSIKFVA